MKSSKILIKCNVINCMHLQTATSQDVAFQVSIWKKTLFMENSQIAILAEKNNFQVLSAIEVNCKPSTFLTLLCNGK